MRYRIFPGNRKRFKASFYDTVCLECQEEILEGDPMGYLVEREVESKTNSDSNLASKSGGNVAESKTNSGGNPLVTLADVENALRKPKTMHGPLCYDCLEQLGEDAYIRIDTTK